MCAKIIISIKTSHIWIENQKDDAEFNDGSFPVENKKKDDKKVVILYVEIGKRKVYCVNIITKFKRNDI